MSRRAKIVEGPAEEAHPDPLPVHKGGHCDDSGGRDNVGEDLAAVLFDKLLLLPDRLHVLARLLQGHPRERSVLGLGPIGITPGTGAARKGQSN